MKSNKYQETRAKDSAAQQCHQQSEKTVVLSGGGGRGAYHVGVLRSLEEHEWFPDIVAGTSIGAVSRSIYRSAVKEAHVIVEGSVVIVTGASAGIGKATAELLARAGADVVVTARRVERLNELVARLESCPGRRLAVPGDIREPAFAQDLINQTVATFGRVDVLINNAGLGHRSLLSEMPLSDVRTIFDTNVLGLLYATQAAVVEMKQHNQGQIINVSSIVSQRPMADIAVYSASKAAVNFISRSLRMELRPYNITVTLVYPGLTATEFAQARLGRPGGNRFGLRGIPAERVGRAIMKAIENGRTEVYVTFYDWLFVHFNRLFPRTTDWIVERITKFA